jgi:hypothetical protein
MSGRNRTMIREAIAVEVAERDFLANHRGVEVGAGVDDQVTGGDAERIPIVT